jgi:hypothetical protein
MELFCVYGAYCFKVSRKLANSVHPVSRVMNYYCYFSLLKVIGMSNQQIQAKKLYLILGLAFLVLVLAGSLMMRELIEDPRV